MSEKIKKPLTKKTKVWILVAALAVVLAAAVTAGAIFLLPKGSPADPKVRWYNTEDKEFVIDTVDELYDLAYLSTKYNFEGQTIKLGADIVINDGDASTWGTNAPSRLWYPIANFNGTFDGQGHTISGLYGVSFNQEMGLFSFTGKYAHVTNLRVVNSYLKSSGEHGTGVISANGGGTFENIYVDAIIRSDNWNNGGILGLVDLNGDTLISNCWFDGEMILVSDQGRVAGGIVGDIMPENGVVTIQHCLNTGKFSAEAITHTGRGRLMDIGGIVGRASSGTTNITDCFANTEIDSGCVVGAGALIGSAGKGKTNLTHSYAVKADNISSVGYRYNQTVGDVYTYTEEYVKGFEAYKWTTLDFENFWAVDEDGTPVLKTFADKIPSLSGVKRMIDTSWYTKRNTATLKTIEQLRGFHVVSQWDNFSGKTIYLGADIVVQEGDASTWGETAPEVVWKGLSSANVMFAGTFDGLGHTVSGMYQKAPANGLGMFVATTDGACIRNLRVENSYFETTNVAVNNQTYSYIGSIAAYARGTIFDSCYSNAIMVSDGYFCGGLVGLMRNGKASTVTNCWFDGVVRLHGESGMRGACLVGQVWNTTLTVSHCLTTGTMTSESWAWGANEGLMVGFPNEKSTLLIEDSVSAGSLTVKDGKKDGNGMIVGRMSPSANSITFDSVFAIRTPDPEAVEGETPWYSDWGLTGYRGIPLTCEGPALILDKEYLTGANAYRYTDLDFKNFWAIDEDGNLRLQTFLDEDAETMDVSELTKAVDYSWYSSESDLYISTREQLMALPLLSTGDSFKDKTVHLSNSITVNYGNAEDWINWAPTYKWTPIGPADNMFQGTFDGHGYTISGIYVSGSGNCLGFFATTRNATIKNFRLTNSFIRSNGVAVSGAKGTVSSYNYTGGIASYAANSTFSGIYTNAIVMNDGEMCGGIVGLINKVNEPVSITNCWFDGKINQEWTKYKKSDGGIYCVYYGGIVGLIRNAEVDISHCAMTGTINGINFPEGTWGSVAGGMIGRIDNTGTNPAPYVTIKDCLADTKIAGYPSSTVGNGTVVAQCNKNAVLHLENVYAVPSTWKPVMQWQSKELGSGEVTTVGASNLTGAKAYINANLNYTYYWSALEGKIPQLKRFASGTVAEKMVIDTSWYDETQTEFVINTADELLGFASLSKSNTFEGKTIKLGADIVLNEGDASTWGENGPSKFWISIGSAASRFMGTFDGQGHTISGIYYQNEGADGTAMFECIDGATVKNFKLVNSYFDDSKETDGTAAWSRVAAIVATAYSGTVSDIYTDAYVSGGSMYNGGIVGMFRAPGTSTTAALTISNCWFDGNLDLGTSGRNSGGIIGGVLDGNKNVTTLNITNCLMSGVIDSQYASEVAPDPSYRETLTAVGGLMGSVINCTINLQDVLVAGEMNIAEGATYCGSLFGYKNWGVGEGTGEDIFIVEGLYGQLNYVNPDNAHNNITSWAVNVKDVEMLTDGQARHTAKGFDFETVWIAVKDALPELRTFSTAEEAPITENADPTVETTTWYDGTQTEYIITTVGQMKGFMTLSQTNNFAGITIKLGNDIAMNDGDAATWSSSAPSEVWKFIGSASNPFKGTFDGQGYTLSGVYYNSTVGSTYVGLFMEVENATIKNLILDNSAMHTTSGSGGNGLLVGRANGVTIENVMVTDSVYGSKSTYSGIVAFANGANAVIFKNVWMAGNLTTEMWTTKYGGLLGGVSNTNGLVITVENCLFTGSIEQKHATSTAANTVGGLVGELASDVKISVKNSLSAGTIITQSGATMYAGSVVGNSSWRGAAYTTYENVYATKDCYSVGTYRQPSEYTGTIKLVDKDDILGGLARWTLPGLNFTTDGAWIAVENAIPELRYFSDATDAPEVEDPGTGPVVLESITVTAPTKTTYDVGASLETDGMVVKAVYSDTSEVELTDADYTVTGFDSSAVGTVTVTVTYEGKTATFDVTIADIPDDPNEETTYWYDGTKTEYVLNTLGEFKGFVTLSQTNTFEGKTIKLNTDITWNEGDAADWATTAPANVWTPIADSDNGFKGVLDGQGHTISGLYVKNSGYAAFVARLYSANAAVKNFRIVNSYFESDGTGDSFHNGAGIVGRANNDATVSGIYTDAFLKGVKGAGIVAFADSVLTCNITSCWFDGTIDVTGATNVGGMIGLLPNNATFDMSNCLFTGTMIGTAGSSAYIGGLVGIGAYNTAINATNCLVAGDMTAITAGITGSVIGNNPGNATKAVYTNVYATSETHTNMAGANGTVSSFAAVKAVAKAEILGNLATAKLTGFDFTNTWTTVENDVPILKIFAETGEGEGDEPVVDPTVETTEWFDGTKTEYTISTIGELKGFVTLSASNTFDGITIKLGTDIVWNEGDAATWATTAPANVWTPISDTNFFEGTFDGQGHTISGLYVKDTNNRYATLFGMLRGGTVKNVSVTNSYLESVVSGTYNSTTHFHCVAGIVGRANAKDSRGSTIEGIYTDAILVGGRHAGIVGFQDAGTVGATIKNCWFDGSIHVNVSTDTRGFGGILGQPLNSITTTIENCLFTGTATGGASGSYIGGLVGMGPYNATITFTNCLSAGDLTAVTTSVTGSVIGNNPGGNRSTYTNVYATSESHANLAGAGGNKSKFTVTAVAKADILGDLATAKLTGFDFTGTWVTVENDVPVLKAFADVDAPADPNAVDTTWYISTETTFTLTTAGQLKGLVELSKTNTFAGKTIKLGANITLNEGDAADWATTAPAYSWTPIGGDATFDGTFDGQGYTISGLYCAWPNGNSMGMFREVKGTVTNFKLVNSYLVNTDEASGWGYNGVIASAVNGGTISKVYTNAIIESVDSYAGGIVGMTYTNGTTTAATISECQFDGVLKARCVLSGDCGLTSGQSRAHANYVGGIIGAANANTTNVSDCVFSGRIMNECHTAHRTGGIVGGMDVAGKSITILRCFSIGMMGTMNHTNNSYHFNMIMDCRGKNNAVTTPTNVATLCTDNYVLATPAYQEDGVTTINNGNNITAASESGISTTRYTEAEMIAKIAADKAAGTSNLDFENVWTYNEGALPTLTAFAD